MRLSMKHLLITLMFFFFLTATAIAAAVNINTADKETLESLPGVGPVKAEAIISYRKDHKFITVDDLAKVKGIGEKTVAKLKEQITVSDK